MANNYGCYQSDEFEALVDEAANSTDIDEQNGHLQEADAKLGEDVAYIPLYILKNYYLRGSKVDRLRRHPVHLDVPRPGCHRRGAVS